MSGQRQNNGCQQCPRASKTIRRC